jgi:MoxR-like ATPase
LYFNSIFERKILLATTNYEFERWAVTQIKDARQRIRTELSKVIIGQQDIIDQLLIAVLSGGHCLITGVPGLAKTLLVKSLAQLFHLSFQRIQFTPDLMPADITGTEILQEGDHERKMVFIKGPVFANMLLADEINRTPPKTQSALLEAMQEHHVTAVGVCHPLSEPFYVFATQNPIEMEGTYPLPEAQLDRFMFNVWIDYLPEEDEINVVRQTTAVESQKLSPIFTGEDLVRFQEVVRKVPVAEDVVRYAVRLSKASRPGPDNNLDFVNEWVTWGAGLRASQYMVLGGKARALLDGRSHVTFDDIRCLAQPVLRHRILTNYRAEAEGVTIKNFIDRLLNAVRQG